MPKAKTGNIVKRGEGYRVSVDTGQRTPEGKRIIVSETVKGSNVDAERRRRELLTELDAGILSTTKETVAGWMARWLISADNRDSKPRTMDKYECDIRQHINPCLGKIPLAKVRLSHVEDWHTTLLDKDLSASSVCSIHQTLQKAMKRAVRHGLIGQNPCTGAKLPKRTTKEIKPPTMAQVRELLELAKADNPRLYPAIHLAAFTGCRRGELAGLQWQNVNLAAGVLRIQQSLNSLSKARGGVQLGAAKTQAGERTIQLLPETVELLQEHRVNIEAEGREMLGAGFNPEGWVFPPMKREHGPIQASLAGWCDVMGNSSTSRG